MAADYDPGDEETLRFFRVIQNKLHFAATGKTADEHAAVQYKEFSARPLGMALKYNGVYWGRIGKAVGTG